MRSTSIRVRRYECIPALWDLKIPVEGERGRATVRDWLRYLGLCLGWLMSCVPWALAVDSMELPAGLPRYKFAVGKQYHYEGSEKFKYEYGDIQDDVRWYVTVLRRNDDGTFRILFRSVDQRTTTEKAAHTMEVSHCGCADVNDLGEFSELWSSFEGMLEPTKVLLRLPATREELANGWQSPEAQFDAVLKCLALADGDEKRPVYEAVEEGPFDTVNEIEHRDRATFDVENGIFAERDQSRRRGQLLVGEGSGTLRLTEVRELDNDICRALAADVERFFSAKQKLGGAEDADDATAESLDSAAAAFQSIRSELTTPEFQQDFDRQCDEFKTDRADVIKQIETRKALIAQPAEAFTTTDLDGQPHALADYRGKVVLLDFWYRGCGWCIRAMPQLREVAVHYRDRPFVLLGMNAHSDADDAKFVVEKLKLEYPNLKAEGLSEKFNVHGFPTMILIDQEGVIRDVRVGWSPTLKKDLIAKIDRLLEADK
jgi:thiol-disulfide isomerase/thioredoxin